MKPKFKFLNFFSFFSNIAPLKLFQRAKGLLIMGQTFIKNGGGVKDGLIDVGERMGLSETFSEDMTNPI